MVQAGIEDTRLSEISLLQLVQGFVKISKKLDISYIGTAEGRKGYLQSILIYYILFIHNSCGHGGSNDNMRPIIMKDEVSRF